MSESVGDSSVRPMELECVRQWLMNHAENCGVIPAWPHGGDCMCPIPATLLQLPTVAIVAMIDGAWE